jgi:hypothetical protein
MPPFLPMGGYLTSSAETSVSNAKTELRYSKLGVSEIPNLHVQYLPIFAPS